MIEKFDRHTLNIRHQLSHEQIDLLRKEKTARKFPEEKLMLMAKYQAFLSILDALCLSGIPVVVLKGFPLSRKLYGDPYLRITGDIDLLLKPQDISRAISILSAAGYAPAISPWPSNYKKVQGFQRFRNQFAMLHPESGIVVELHWRLLYFPVKSHDTLETLVWDNLVEQKTDGRSFFVLNDELELLYLIIHGGLHGWNRLKWLLDVESYARLQGFSADGFTLLCRKLKAHRMVGLYNHLTRTLPGGGRQLPGPPSTLPFLINTAVGMIQSDSDDSFHTPKSLLRFAMFVIRAFPGLGYKWRMLVFSLRSAWFNLLVSSAQNSSPQLLKQMFRKFRANILQ